MLRDLQAVGAGANRMPQVRVMGFGSGRRRLSRRPDLGSTTEGSVS